MPLKYVKQNKGKKKQSKEPQAQSLQGKKSNIVEAKKEQGLLLKTG